MSKRSKTYLPYFLSVLAVTIFVVYLYQNAARYRQLLDYSPRILFLQVGLMFAFMLANGSINYFFYRGLMIPLTLYEGIGLAAVNTLANQLPFAGGMVAKGMYLKQKYGLEYTRYFSATIALYNCFVAVNGIVGLAVLAYWRFWRNSHVPIILLLAFGGMAATVAFLFMRINAAFLPLRWRDKFTQLLEGWQVLSRNPLLIGQLLLVQLFLTFLFAWRFWIAFRVLSQDIAYSQCVLFASATVLTRLVSIMPGGLGVREGIVAGLAAIGGYDPGVSMVAVGIDRLIETIIVMTAGVFYTYVLSRHLTGSRTEKKEV